MLTLIKHSAATSLEKGISLDTDMSFDSVISRDRSIENETFPKDKEMTDQLDDPDTPQMQDTVGAVCMDWQGHLAAAVSSGGIWLKHPGRLGAVSYHLQNTSIIISTLFVLFCNDIYNYSKH